MSVNKDFNPSFSHRFYFMRRGLLSSIKKNASSLNGKLLDFGCGSKPYQSLFKVEEYVGLDYEKTGHDHRNEQIDVFYDGKTIPFPDKYFDSILCSEVVEHLFELNGVLSEMNRVLKDKGKLLVTCPFVWPEHEVPYDFARYTQFAVKSIFEKAGFRIIEYSKEGNFMETITQLRVLYFLEWAEPILSKLSFPGRWLQQTAIFLMNGWGTLKRKIMPVKYGLYLSNVLLVEKVENF